MTETLTATPISRPPVSRTARILAILILGSTLALLVVVAVVVRHELTHTGKIYPGVSVGGVDVSGRTPAEAAALLTERIQFPLTGRIAFRDGSDVWVATPVEVGLFLDAESSARMAYEVGRRGGPLRRLVDQHHARDSGVMLPPLMIYNEGSAQAYLQNLASQIDRPTIEADLGLEGVEVVIRSGQVGRTLDIAATLEALEPRLREMTDTLIPLEIEETPPVILDASEQARVVEEILREPLILSLPDPQEGDPAVWTLDPPALASLLAIERVEGSAGGRYEVGLEDEQVRVFLESLAPDLTISAVDARFVFDDDAGELELLQHAVIGRELDVEATLEKIHQGLMAGEHEIALAFDYQEPAVQDDATAQALGITELVSNETSFFYGSSSPRIQNIQTAASRFHGLLVAPGETFSMAEVLGDVSLDNGYAEALIIFGDRTIQGVGGGVCQVSTTLFRTVFFGGFPVAERHPHAYRVYYYELTASGAVNDSLAGLDATVYVPLVDFKFVNDSPHWLLMETYVNPEARTLNWRFYSTSDGRSVDWQTTGLRNRVEPPEPLYQENPELDKGEIEQVDWEVDGADVTVTRTVSRGDQTILQDTFSTHYMPWRAVYEYGPGTEGIPDPEATDEPEG